MGKLWIPGGGSGAGSGSDECTASKSEVLKGYSAVTSDSDDEPIQGTLELTGDASDGQVLSGKTYYNTDPKKKKIGSMANQGAVSVKLNAGEGYTIPSGFHNGGGKVEANGLASQTPGTATSAHILSGQSAWVNGNKVNGGIPLQNVEISGTDRAWAQGMSNWAGTINLKVRNGHYLNGVNWIQQDIPNYRPENIKKGINIGGIIGTAEGYVPTPTDLYLRGYINPIMNNMINRQGSVAIDTGQITFYKNESSQYNGFMVTGSYAKLINLSGYNYLNAEFEIVSANQNIDVVLGISQSSLMSETISRFVASTIQSKGLGKYTMSFPVSNYQLNATVLFGIRYSYGYECRLNLYHLWLS